MIKKSYYLTIRVCIVVILLCLALKCGFGYKTPVEESNGNDKIVDSIITENNKIKIVINNLDSIKNAKVIEVKSLDNDSTVKLFYELVTE